MSLSRRWFAPATGLAFPALLVAWLLIIARKEPIDSAVPQDIVSFYNQNNARVMIGWTLLALAGVAFLFFAGTLWRVLRSAEGSTGWLSTVMFGGGIVAAGGMLLMAGLAMVLGYITGSDLEDVLDPVGFQAIHVLALELTLPAAYGMAAFLLAGGLLVIRTRVLPGWLGWVALVLAVIDVVPALQVGLFASSLWVFAASIVLMRGMRPVVTAGAT